MKSLAAKATADSLSINISILEKVAKSLEALAVNFTGRLYQILYDVKK